MTAAHRGKLFLLAAAPPMLGAALGLAPTHAAAQEQQPYIEFDMTGFTGRNPFLTLDDRARTSGGEISAQGGLGIGIDPKTALDLDGRIAYRRYDRRYGSFTTGRASAELKYRDDERLSLSSRARFDRSLPLETLASTIDAAVDPISLQESYALEQNVRWRPDAHTSFAGEISWNRRVPLGSVLLAKTDATSFGASAERHISPYTWIGLGGVATFSESADGSDSNSAIVVLKVGTRIGRYFSAQAEGGISKITRTESDGRRNDNPAQPTASVSLCYDPRRLRVCLSGRISPVVTSFGGIQREKTLNATVQLQTSERGTLSATADYRAVPGPTFETDTKVMRLSTAYEHRLDNRFRLHVGADYDRRTGLSSQTLGTWTVRVGVTFRIPSR